MNFQCRFLNAIVLFGLISSLAGCAAVNSVSLTPIPAQRSRPVKAEVSKWLILGIAFDNDFIDPLVGDLKQQCPNGVVSGILTKDETYSYLLVFKKQVTATGFCNISQAKALRTATKGRLPGSADEPGTDSLED